MTALYRKYRSGVLGELIGQDHIVRTLGNELRAGKLSHAYLFAGIRGTGKTSTARILARAINCLEPSDAEPCNRCTACRAILDGSAVDVLEIDAASNRGIDEMRDLRERVRYLPAQLRSKVYIIDEAHMLTPEAWNAFLKTLEEPPAHVVFVLCTTEPHKVPETVRSRVQRFDFGRVPSADIESHLRTISEAEEVELEPAAARLIARAAQGSVRDALSLLDQCFATGERPLTPDTCRRGLGLADPELIREILQGLAVRDAAAALRAASAAFEAGADPRQLLRECSRLARAAELVAVGYPEGARLDAEEEGLCRGLAAREPGGFWLRVLEVMGATELELRQPVDARLQLEACLLRLCRDDRSAVGEPERLAELLARLEALERRTPSVTASAPGGAGRPTPSSGYSAPSTAPPATRRESRPAKPPPTVASSPPAEMPSPSAAAAAPSSEGAATDQVEAPPSQQPVPASLAEPPATEPSGIPGDPLVSLEAWQRAWPALIEAVNRHDKVFAGVLRGCRPLDADAERLVVGTPYRFHLNQLRNPVKTPILEGAVSAVAGASRALTVEFCGESVPSTQPGAEEAGAKLTDSVLAAFAGSRVTSTRLVDHAEDPPAGSGPDQEQ